MTLKLLLGIIQLAFAYTIIGKVALILAIPPGYATAIFPSAGVSVAALLIWGYRYSLGIFLGSCSLNIWISLQSGTLNLETLIVPIIAASGATLQAIVGACLVRRTIGFQTTLTKEKDILLFMLTAGPLACLINASFSVTGLLLTGLINSDQYSYSWFNWWVGDSIGVMLGAPLMLIFFANPRPLWRGRRFSVAVPLVLMLTLTISLFIGASRWEYERLQYDFKEISGDIFDKLKSSFHLHVDAVASIERFFYSSSFVSRTEFKVFVKNLLKRESIHGLSWNEVVSNSQRDYFEKRIRAEGYSDFSITQRDSQGQLIKATKKDEYIPVTYIEPMRGNEQAFGFDVSSNNARLNAMTRAKVTGLPVATGRITLVQETEKQSGFLLFYPVFNKPGDSQVEMEKSLLGYAVGVFKVGNIVEASLSNKNKKSISIGIYDDAGLKGESVLYGPSDVESYTSSLFEWAGQLDVGGRIWTVRFWSTDDYFRKHRAWQAWAILATGLLFSSILGAFLLAMTGRSFHLDILVRERTSEIEDQKLKLIEANGFLEINVKELERSNEELDQYAFIASHDLKSPLQSIFQLASWIEEDCSDIFPEETKRHLITLKERINRMGALLSDLLVFSRISRDDYQIELIHIQTLVEKSYTFNSISSNFRLVTMNCDAHVNLPRIPLELALRNLMSNAVKHHNKNTGRICVSYDRLGNEHVISVTDDGPGIPPHLQEKAITMFSTLKPRDDVEGSGLGLAIVRKAVERFGGRLEIVSDGVCGTTVQLYWPCL